MHQQINNSSAASYRGDQRVSAVSSSNQDSNNRMSTRHKGQRVHDYAAMVKNKNVYSPPNKRFKMGEGQQEAGGAYAANRGKHVSSRSKGSGLGFADSEEEREAKEVRPFGQHEESQEPEEEGEQEQSERNQSEEEQEHEEQGESENSEEDQ